MTTIPAPLPTITFSSFDVTLAQGQDVIQTYLERDLSCINPDTPGVHEALQVFTGPWTPVITVRHKGRVSARCMVVMATEPEGYVECNPRLIQHPIYAADPISRALAHIAAGAMNAEDGFRMAALRTVMPAKPGQLLPSIDLFNTIHSAADNQLLLGPGEAYNPHRPEGKVSTFGPSGAADGRAPKPFSPRMVRQVQQRLEQAWAAALPQRWAAAAATIHSLR